MIHKAVFLEYRKTKDIGLRNKIVEDHMYMVDILIRKYLNRGVEYDDLYQVARSEEHTSELQSPG